MKKLILIRHAERGSIASTEVGNEVLLTEQGKVDTASFARTIDSPILSIKSSPIKRCIQTAEILADINSYPQEQIECSTLLGDPGLIIADGQKAWQQWQKLGADAVNQHLLSGNARLAGFADLDLAVKKLIFQIKALFARSNNGTHIWVTHDTVVATIASRVQKQPLSLDDWPHFLGRLEIRLTERGQLDFLYDKNQF